MMTVHEVGKLAGVSIRTLQYYDRIGLLHPTGYTDAGYRLYDDTDLERLQHILLFQELEFPLKDIKNIMESPDFDRSKLDEYAGQAKARWGNSPQYKEFEKKAENRTKKEDQMLADQCMLIFQAFGEIRNTDPASREAQTLVDKLQNFFTRNFYNCTDEILSGLGKMYSGGGDFTKNIDEYGGEGTAAFVDKAIQIHCGSYAYKWIF